MFRCQLTGEVSDPREKSVVAVIDRYGPNDFISVRKKVREKNPATGRYIEKMADVLVSLEGQIKKELRVRAKNLHLIKVIPVPSSGTRAGSEIDNSWIPAYKRYKASQEGREEGEELKW